jgi:hypothetical protein
MPQAPSNQPNPAGTASGLKLVLDRFPDRLFIPTVPTSEAFPPIGHL